MDAALVVAKIGIASILTRIPRRQLGMALLCFFELSFADGLIMLARISAGFDSIIRQRFFF